MAKILIKNGRVWDGYRFTFSDVLTDGEKIAKIAPEICDETAFVYDAAGKTVSAGSVDLHLHLRGVSSPKYGVQGESACFPFGVTAAADAGAEYGDKALLDSFQLKSLVFVTVGIKNNRAYFEKTEEILSAYGEKAFGIKVYFDTASGQVRDVAPLREVCSFARERGLPVMVHSSRQPIPMAALLDELQAGDILTHAFHGGENSAAADGFESLREAQKRGVIVDAGFAGHVHTDFSVLRGAVEQGVIPDTISTDLTCLSAYTRGGRYGMTACMSMARTAGMAEEDVFRAVTSAPAKALGKEDFWGCLREGGRADLAVFDATDEAFDFTDGAGNRLHDTKGYRCKLTVADGRIVYKD